MTFSSVWFAKKLVVKAYQKLMQGLKRIRFISNIHDSEQNFKSLEFVLRNSAIMLLISKSVISNISLFRTFFPVPWQKYHPLIRTFRAKLIKTTS